MSDYLSRAQVASAFPISVSYLEKAAYEKPVHDGPRYIKIGKKVVYRKQDVIDWFNGKLPPNPFLSAPPAPSPIKRGRGRPRKIAPSPAKSVEG